MKIVVIGGTGLIGSKTVAILREEGHEVVAGSPKSGVNTITGKGLKEAMAGAQVALAAPRNGIVEIAGPERAPFNELVARYLKAVGDPRQVVRDPEVRYFGGRVEERSLVPLGEARLGHIGLNEWLRRSKA